MIFATEYDVKMIDEMVKWLNVDNLKQGEPAPLREDAPDEIKEYYKDIHKRMAMFDGF
ncbi:hypothetical protein SAMN05216249_10463 [Acetitomaculum ruminis DSM 5522]|uniref:Uncharacterized protein n=1 Tax=Acetitomaculum ruminis DSM 5522 TaxID=1120918 RepID=A0A1I0WI86_9FIRM|nr:hypothetical protein [Acetitomaculum ruminis]SFA87723.1 hypothetical protein SAMN05216249_10463 [Acetitomaculum ruminis DSM 5522]